MQARSDNLQANGKIQEITLNQENRTKRNRKRRIAEARRSEIIEAFQEMNLPKTQAAEL
jgi:hypothetical protein